MDKKQNPFGIYDFLGYFIPGAVCIYSFIFINEFVIHGYFDYDGIVKSLVNFESAGIYVPFILGSYVLGHFLSYLSSISIEKYSIWKYSYPSKYLLNIKHDGFWGAKRKRTQKIWRCFIVLLIFPIFIFDLTIGSIFKFTRIYTKELDSFLIELIRQKKKMLINKLGSDLESYENKHEIDFYRIILHHTYEHSKQHQSKLQNYVALYGFSRTICIIHVIIIWFLSIYMIFNDKLLNFNFILLTSFLSFSSYIFFMNFMKFYRRYTLEGFMILLILDNREDN